MNKVHNKCSHGKNNWGKWTNHPASSRWQTLQLFRSNKPQHHQLYRHRHIDIYTRLLGSQVWCLQTSTILHLQYCKTLPESREVSTLRYPLHCQTGKVTLSGHLDNSLSPSLHHRSFLLWDYSTFTWMGVK